MEVKGFASEKVCLIPKPRAVHMVDVVPALIAAVAADSVEAACNAVAAVGVAEAV